MSHTGIVDSVGSATLHGVSAGLTAASIAGAWGYVSGVLGILPIIIAGCAGIAAIVSYTFATLDSPTFQRRMAKRAMRRKQKQLEKLRRQQVVLSAKLQALDTIDQAKDTARQMVADAQQGVLAPQPEKIKSTPPV